MKDQWRIVYRHTNGNWRYCLERKKKFLLWEYWSFITYSTDDSKEIENLEWCRDHILEQEQKKFKVIKEWN